MIVITGATGRLGSAVVDRLLQRVPAAEVAVSVRDPGKAAALAERGVRVRRGDFTDPASLEHAFAGADRVLVVSAAMLGDPAVAANTAAIDAARAAGASHVLYTSHQAAAKDSLFAPQPTHAATEDHLARLGIPFTALRNGFYTSTLGMHVGAALDTGRLVAPEDGPVSWTAHADLADVAVAALLDPAAPVFDGVTPPLTAPDLLDLSAVAAVLGELTGRAIERVVVTDDDWAAAARERGVPEFAVGIALGQFRAARNGEFAVTGPALESILGRPATPVRSVLADVIAG